MLIRRPGTVTPSLRSHRKASPFWIIPANLKAKGSANDRTAGDTAQRSPACSHEPGITYITRDSAASKGRRYFLQIDLTDGRLLPDHLGVIEGRSRLVRRHKFDRD